MDFTGIRRIFKICRGIKNIEYKLYSLRKFNTMFGVPDFGSIWNRTLGENTASFSSVLHMEIASLTFDSVVILGWFQYTEHRVNNEFTPKPGAHIKGTHGQRRVPSSQTLFRPSRVSKYSLPRSRFLDVTQRSPKKGCEGD